MINNTFMRSEIMTLMVQECIIRTYIMKKANTIEIGIAT